MNDRLTASEITDDQLDALYERARLAEVRIALALAVLGGWEWTDTEETQHLRHEIHEALTMPTEATR